MGLISDTAELSQNGRSQAVRLPFAYRFEGDPFCRAERFAAYQEALGDRFVPRVLPDSAAATGTPMKPHSVVTLHLIDRAGEPTRQAVDEILAFFAERLR